MSDPAALAALTDTIRNVILTKYIYVAASTLLAWDILLTFDQEISSVWFTRNSLGKTLFLINRYVAPILFAFDLTYQLHPSPSLILQEGFLPSSLLGILALTVVQFVLVMRTYALYQNRILLISLSLLCIISGATMMGVFIYMFAKLVITLPAGTLPLVPGCLYECSAPLCRTILTAFWIPFFTLETIIFLLTLYKSYVSYRDVGLRYTSNLVTIVYRDGLIYYIVIMSISIVNLVVWVVAPVSLVCRHKFDAMSPGDHCLKTTPQHPRNTGTGVHDSDTIISDVILRPTAVSGMNDSKSFLRVLLLTSSEWSVGG